MMFIQLCFLLPHNYKQCFASLKLWHWCNRKTRGISRWNIHRKENAPRGKRTLKYVPVYLIILCKYFHILLFYVSFPCPKRELECVKFALIFFKRKYFKYDTVYYFALFKISLNKTIVYTSRCSFSWNSFKVYKSVTVLLLEYFIIKINKPIFSNTCLSYVLVDQKFT